nr:hypothetical protein [Frankia sp. Cr1]
MERLDIRHHPLIGEGLLAVLLRDLDISLAIHQILDVDRGYLEALDGVRGCDCIGDQELPEPLSPFQRHGLDVVPQRIPHAVDLAEHLIVGRSEGRSGVEHASTID